MQRSFRRRIHPLRSIQVRIPLGRSNLLDPISVAEVQKIILELKTRGIGVIITDHNVRETLRIVDRAYLLEKGKVHFEGTGEELIKDEQARKFYLGEDFNM